MAPGGIRKRAKVAAPMMAMSAAVVCDGFAEMEQAMPVPEMAVQQASVSAIVYTHRCFHTFVSKLICDLWQGLRCCCCTIYPCCVQSLRHWHAHVRLCVLSNTYTLQCMCTADVHVCIHVIVS